MMEVLKEKTQIVEARQAMIQKNVSLVDSKLKALLKRFGLASGVTMGDVVKSWDVLRTLEFIEGRLDKGDPIADIGCYASEVLVALCKLGYTNLTGIDLNPKLSDMPYQERIRYEVSDFKRTRFPDASFKAITSISVIEHGFEAEPLLKEMSRLLMPGGHFIASFDYWPEKVDTSTTKFFDMDWIIFSKEDIDALVAVAAKWGLHPVGPLNFAAGERVIDCAGKQYTFGMLALRKSS
jgi:SAM-dependent methyltransferase